MSRPANDIVASTILFRVVDCLAEHGQLGRPLPVDLLGDLCAGLRDIAQHVMAPEAVARDVGLLGEREYMRAVRSLPASDRQSLARAALAQAEGNILRFPRGAR